MSWSGTNGELINLAGIGSIRYVDITPDSTTAAAISHGGPAGITPVVLGIYNTQANPTGTEVVVTAVSSSTVTVDVEGTGARPRVLLFFQAASRQDGQSISQDNNT